MFVCDDCIWLDFVVLVCLLLFVDLLRLLPYGCFATSLRFDLRIVVS